MGSERFELSTYRYQSDCYQPVAPARLSYEPKFKLILLIDKLIPCDDMTTQQINPYRSPIQGLIREAMGKEFSLIRADSYARELNHLHNQDGPKYLGRALKCFVNLSSEMNVDGNKRVRDVVCGYLMQPTASKSMVAVISL